MAKSNTAFLKMIAANKDKLAAPVKPPAKAVASVAKAKAKAMPMKKKKAMPMQGC